MKISHSGNFSAIDLSGLNYGTGFDVALLTAVDDALRLSGGPVMVRLRASLLYTPEEQAIGTLAGQQTNVPVKQAVALFVVLAAVGYCASQRWWQKLFSSEIRTRISEHLLICKNARRYLDAISSDPAVGNKYGNEFVRLTLKMGTKESG